MLIIRINRIKNNSKLLKFEKNFILFFLFFIIRGI